MDELGVDAVGTQQVAEDADARGVRRFDDRRALIVTEANDIGTAYLRIELLPEAAQLAEPLREPWADGEA